MVVVILVAAAWITLSRELVSDNCPFFFNTLLDCVSKSTNCPNNVTSSEVHNCKHFEQIFQDFLIHELVCRYVQEAICGYRHETVCSIDGVTDTLCLINLQWNTC